MVSANSNASSRDVKCPSCGGKLLFDPVEQMVKCDFCGNRYSPEKIDLMLQLPEIDAGEADENEEDKLEIVCDSCGAVLITDKNTAATSCTFCGSPAIITRRLSKRFRPDYIIPFKITREEAESNITQFAGSKKYVPADFFDKSNLESIKGIYVPFWLLSSRCKVSVRGEGVKSAAMPGSRYILMSDFDVKYNNVPFDGSLEINDALMESVEPFDISERKPFQSSYLQGFYAQKFNLETGSLCDRILTRMEQYGKETARLAFSEYDSVKFGACAAKPYDLEHAYALYPVWFLNYSYGGKKYMCAVNGQTGKTDGYLPVDEAKRRLRLIGHRIIDALLITLGIALFAAFLFALYQLGAAFITSTAGFVLLLGCVCLISPLGMMTLLGYQFKSSLGEKIEPALEFLTRPVTILATKRRRSYMNLLNETNNIVGPRPPAEEYYDSKAKIEFENQEAFRSSDQ